MVSQSFHMGTSRYYDILCLLLLSRILISWGNSVAQSGNVNLKTTRFQFDNENANVASIISSTKASYRLNKATIILISSIPFENPILKFNWSLGP